MIKTRITELLGIEHPIIQGGMMHVGLAELASAVSNAGGLFIGLIEDIPSCQELISRMVSDAEDIIARRLQGMLADTPVSVAAAG